MRPPDVRSAHPAAAGPVRQVLVRSVRVIIHQDENGALHVLQILSWQLTIWLHVDILQPRGVGTLQPRSVLHMAKDQRGLSRIELLQGTLDLIVLQTLRWGPRHGYGIAQMIRANSRDALQVDTGSLYPALHRLERTGAIAAEWETSENRQRVRVYRLTAAGRKQLAAERSRWDQLSEAIAGILAPPLPEGDT